MTAAVWVRGAVVGNDIVDLDEEPRGFPDLPQRPPDRLDVSRCRASVGVFEIDPEADPLRQRFQFIEELNTGLAAAMVESGDCR